jgi:hypothetical protein
MSGAFQRSAFQNNAFQVDIVVRKGLALWQFHRDRRNELARLETLEHERKLRERELELEAQRLAEVIALEQPEITAESIPQLADAIYVESIDAAALHADVRAALANDEVMLAAYNEQVRIETLRLRCEDDAIAMVLLSMF